MVDTHINVFIDEAKQARVAITGAIEDFKHKVSIVKSKYDQLEGEVEPAVENAIEALENDLDKLTKKDKAKKETQASGK